MGLWLDLWVRVVGWQTLSLPRFAHSNSPCWLARSPLSLESGDDGAVRPEEANDLALSVAPPDALRAHELPEVVLHNHRRGLEVDLAALVLRSIDKDD